MPTDVLLLRHAESAWNATGRWQGWADPELSAEGLRHARAAASSPALDVVTAAVSSDLVRASTTASIIATARGWPPVTVVRGLRERNAGEWTGLTRAEIEARWPGSLGRNGVVIPGGESDGAVTARAVATLHRIADAHPGTSVLAVTHGGLIRMVLAHAGGVSRSVANLSGVWVSVGAEGVTLGLSVSLVDVGSAA